MSDLLPAAPDNEPRLDDAATLRAEVTALRAQLAALERRIDPPAASPSPSVGTSRRRAMQVATGAAVGALASAVAARPAAADDPNDVTLGAVKETPSRPTGVRYTGISNGVSTLFAAGGGATGFSAEFPAAVGAWSHMQNMPNGLYGFSDQNGGAGVVGKNEDGSGGVGVHGIGRARGVKAEIRDSNTGVALEGSGGGTGLSASGSSYGAEIRGNSFGITVRSEGTHLWIQDTVPPPESGAFLRYAGQVVRDDDDRVMVCVEDGTPGRWQVIASPIAAGAFHAVGPYRVYDSRLDVFAENGPLAPGASRVVSVADAILPDGTPDEPDVVHPGATAVAFNLTVTQTQAPNFLAVAPGDATAATTSSINWWQPGLSLANGTNAPISDARELKVFCGPNGGATQFVIDITGFWR